jgi:amino acid adenylation domain-containing protein
LRQSFARLKADLAEQPHVERLALPELWIESVPAEANDALAARHRYAEMRRAVRSTVGWRPLVLEYQGSVVDLIIVAQRAVMDSSSIQTVADAIINGSCRPRWSTQRALQLLDSRPVPGPGLSTLDDGSQLDWCVGHLQPEDRSQEGNVQIDLGSDVDLDAAILVVAAGVMAGRYGSLQNVFVATVGRGHQREPGTITASESLTLVPVRCGERIRATQEIDSVRDYLAIPVLWRPLEAADNLEQRQSVGAAIGVFVGALTRTASTTVRPSEYLPVQTPPCPLTMILHQDPRGRISLQCSYLSSRFDGGIVEQFIRSVAEAYLGLLKNSDVDLRDVNTLSPNQETRLAAIGRSRVAPPVARERIDQVFEQVVRRSPSAPALVFGETRLDYCELDEYANRIAHVLRGRGVRDGDRVGVCLDRSLELVIVLLGVMKAGATYVPMDPAYPLERLEYMTRDAGLRVVVSSKSDFPAGSPVDLLSLQQLVEFSKAHPSDPVESAVSGEGAAYIIYTSGSTGRPKGVVIPHHNVLSLIDATRDDFHLSGDDTWTLFHSSAFDFSVWEMWGCLLTGGRLIVVPYWVSRSPSEFLELLSKERVTVLNQTPSAFAQLIEADRTRPTDLALRLVIFGGEPLNTRMLVPWFDRRPETVCRLVNMFGITETTVHVTAESITRNHALKSSRSVGRPLPGWHLYVMDAEGRLVPPGVPGEICVSGAGVALYYVNRADLTAEKFVPDPFGHGRMYRSGDRGRLLPDGRLEHLGRLDSQVKIRGFRIEISEIQSVLLEAPGVAAAAVVLQQEDLQDPASARLNAYVVLKGGRVDEVRNHISRVLPDYMMPASISVLSSLPLTNNGKLDVARLPKPSAPVAPAVAPQSAAAAPASQLAGVLLEIWRKVLKVPLGVDDNFFDLGGNSLYAVRIGAAMREQGLPPLPLRDLYVHQTIRRIANGMDVRAKQVPA